MLWSLLCVLLAIYGVLHAWIRSKMCWMDFLIMRGAFHYVRLWHRWSSNRPAPFPRAGPAVIVCNHTCSADPTFLLAACMRGPSFLVAHEHFNLHPVCFKILTHLKCVPVVRSGRDPVAARRALRRLDEGALVCLYPEGNLSGVALNTCRRPKHGMAYLALKKRVPVYPVCVTGGPRTDQLLRSWVFPSTTAVRIHFGPPIDLSAYYDRPLSRALLEEVADLIMSRVHAAAPGHRPGAG